MNWLPVPVILNQARPLPPKAGPAQQFTSGFISKFTVFVFLDAMHQTVSRERKQYLSGRVSEWDAEMQSGFNNIGSLSVAPKIRSRSPSLLEIHPSWWEYWHDPTPQWSHHGNFSNPKSRGLLMLNLYNLLLAIPCVALLMNEAITNLLPYSNDHTRYKVLHIS